MENPKEVVTKINVTKLSKFSETGLLNTIIMFSLGNRYYLDMSCQNFEKRNY